MAAIGPSKVPGKKAGPNGSFPVGDKKHARLAIGGATHSYNAGNISKAQENHIKGEARDELGEKPSWQDAAKAKSRAKARLRRRSISRDEHDKIVAKANAVMAREKK